MEKAQKKLKRTMSKAKNPSVPGYEESVDIDSLSLEGFDDPLESYCETSPEAYECRLYDQ